MSEDATMDGSEQQTDRQLRLAPDRQIALLTCPRLRFARLMMMKMKLPPNLIKIPNDLHMEHSPQLNKPWAGSEQREREREQ